MKTFFKALAAGCLLLAIAGDVLPAAEKPDAERPITLKAWGVPDGSGYGPTDESLLRIMATFRERFPQIRLVSDTGLTIPGRTMDITPLMQIAGDVAADVMYVNFRQSDTFIRNKFLYPLDRYIEEMAGVDVPGGERLDTAAYVARLRRGPAYAGASIELVRTNFLFTNSWMPRLESSRP